jgi:ribulose-phosphate 3-epimerase
MNVKLPVLAPSILAADFTKLGEQIKICTDSGIDWIHCDIMDGHFVPNISYGADIVAAAADSAGEAFIDVHLMIENPDQYIEDFRVGLTASPWIWFFAAECHYGGQKPDH